VYADVELSFVCYESVIKERNENYLFIEIFMKLKFFITLNKMNNTTTVSSANLQ
jgi:hypothetical protein